MNLTTLLIVFIAVTSVAVVLQTFILAGLGIAVLQMGKRMQAMQVRVNEQLLPLVEKVRGLVDESTPKIQTVITNVAETSDMVRAQATKIDEAVTQIVGMARSQAVRVDGLTTRTLERVDHTAAAVQDTVTKPVRKLSALMDGVAAGVSKLTGGKNQRGAKAVPSDEMFI
jgi:methyl-accepting chemotaxis protein